VPYTDEDVAILERGSWTDNDGEEIPFLATNRFGDPCPNVEAVAHAVIDVLPEVKRFLPDALAQHGMHHEQITQAVFGDITENLKDYISDITSVAASGPVQKRLAPKQLVLCGGRVRRPFTYVDDDGNESEKEVPVTVRLVTKNERLVRQLYLAPTITKRERQAAVERENAAMVGARIRALLPYTQNEFPRQVIEAYQRGWGRELTNGNGTGYAEEDGEGEEESS